MALLHGLVAADERVGEAARRLLGEEQLDIVAQCALVALQRQHVVGALASDLLGDVALAAHQDPRT